MKKYLLLCLAVLIFTINFINPNKINSFATNENNIIIRAYGDSISYGETLSNTADAYPAVFAKTYVDNFNADFIAKGVSGYTSTDLLNDLTTYKNGTASDIDSFIDTDIVTLCIGANNILSPTLSNISAFLKGTINEQDLVNILNQGVEQFKQDFPKILETFDGKDVVVMTIYNPYKYTSLNDISIDTSISSYTSTIKSALSVYQIKFNKMLEISMSALQKINDEIRNSASNKVSVVDIWNLFETFDKEQYLQFINADISKLVIKSTDLYAILSNNLDIVFSKIVTNCDPHPTQSGHSVIAQTHKNTYSPFKITSNNSSLNEITFNINSILTGDFVYKFYKESNSSKVLLKEIASDSFSLKKNQITETCNVFAEVYKDNNLIATTNKIKFTYTPPTETQKPNQNENSNQLATLSNNKNWLYISLGVFALFVAIGVIIGVKTNID